MGGSGSLVPIDRDSNLHPRTHWPSLLTSYPKYICNVPIVVDRWCVGSQRVRLKWDDDERRLHKGCAQARSSPRTCTRKISELGSALIAGDEYLGCERPWRPDSECGRDILFEKKVGAHMRQSRAGRVLLWSRGTGGRRLMPGGLRGRKSSYREERE